MEKQKKYKLAISTTHPIQYQAPFFRKLAENPEIELKVYFYSDYGVTEKKDPGFGISFKWDIPLLEGYKYKFLKNFFPFLNGSRLWLSFNPGIIREIWKEKFEAILIYGYNSLNNWLVVLTARILGIPILLGGEAFFRPNKRWWQKIIRKILLKIYFPQIKVFLPIGKESKKFYRYYGVPDEKMFLFPYSVDNDFFIKESKIWKGKKELLKKEIGIPENMPVILYVSKMISVKRPMDLLKAFERLKREAALIFVGDGELRPELEEYASRRKIKNVFFAGFKNQSELPKYYSLADIFVFPSAIEQWGLVVNEAMCFGLPIITTNGVAASSDLVRHGENGFIYPPGDVEKLIQYLKKTLEDPTKRQKMGEKSLEIISNWDYDICLKNLLTVLKICQETKK